MKKIFFVFALMLLPFFGSISYSQEIRATVSINMEQIPFESRTQLLTMENDITRYINSQKFTNIEWKGDPIPVDMVIYLSGGSNNKYSARLLVVSKRVLSGPKDFQGQAVNIKFYDDKWSFVFGAGANLSFNIMKYDDFTTLIDYYMSLVIGFDLDTYGELDGSPAYDQAKSLVLLGASNNGNGYTTNSSPGEFTRYNLVSDLTDIRYNTLRKLLFAYYVDGLDVMYTDRAKAKENIIRIIDEMADFKQKKMVGPSVLLQAFFDSKAQELCTMFNGFGSEKLYSNLMYLDPGNSTIYLQAKEGKYK
jgi:hypothetical protein